MPSWTFGDGRRWAGTSTSFVIYNPGTEPADVVLATRVDNSIDDVEPFSASVQPGELAVISLDEDDRVPPRASYWAAVQSKNGAPIVVERVITPAAGGASGGSAGASGDRTTSSTSASGTGTSGSGAGGEGAGASAEPDDATKADPIYKVETAATGITLGTPAAARRWIVPVGGADGVAAALVAVTSLADQPVTLSIFAVADGQQVPVPLFDQVALEPGRRTTLRVSGLPLEASHRMLLIEASGPVVVDQTLVSESPSPSVAAHAAIPVRDSLVMMPADLVNRASTAETVPPSPSVPPGSGEPGQQGEPGSAPPTSAGSASTTGATSGATSTSTSAGASGGAGE